MSTKFSHKKKNLHYEFNVWLTATLENGRKIKCKIFFDSLLPKEQANINDNIQHLGVYFFQELQNYLEVDKKDLLSEKQFLELANKEPHEQIQHQTEHHATPSAT